MLNPPLSLLSDDLLDSIVDQVAKLPFPEESLDNLCLADRAFIQSCQKYIFRKLKLGSYEKRTSIRLKKVKKILDDNPSFANRVRMIEVGISKEENASVFNDPNFTGILQLFSKLPIPPHELHFRGISLYMVIEDPLLVTRQLAESFFSQTLTILRLEDILRVPLPLFLICPRLKEVFLDIVEATDKSYDTYPDNYCSGRDAPLLEVLKYRNSHSLVEQMITPPPRFNIPVVIWSNLRVLTVTPYDKEGMAYLQPILDAACNTLEELYLTGMAMGDFQQVSFAELVNLSKLPNLHVFSLAATVNCKKPGRGRRNMPPFAALHDINVALGTIPDSNRVTNLWFDFSMIGRRGSQHPFLGCLNQDWVGLFNEVIRIGGGKPLELELQLSASMGFLEDDHPDQDELYVDIMEQAALLSNYPKICTHFWNPTYWTREIGPFPRGQVLGRCR